MAVGWANDDSVSQQIQIPSTTRFPVFVAILNVAKVLTIMMNVGMRYLKRVKVFVFVSNVSQQSNWGLNAKDYLIDERVKTVNFDNFAVLVNKETV